MSREERIEQNKVRFSREITLGDLLLALTIGIPLIVAQVRLYDTVQDHEKRMSIIEQQQIVQDVNINAALRSTAINSDRLTRLKHQIE